MASTQEKNPSSRWDLSPRLSMIQLEDSPAKWMYGPNQKDEHIFSFAGFSSSKNSTTVSKFYFGQHLLNSPLNSYVV